MRQPAKKLEDDLTMIGNWVDELPEQFREVISRDNIKHLLTLDEEQRLALISKWYEAFHRWDNEEQRKARRVAFAKRAAAWRMWRDAKGLRDEAAQHNATVKVTR